jgi:hypothetical protein
MMIPRLFAAAIAILATISSACAAEPRTFPDCNSGGLNAGDWGATQLASYVDPAGRRVEVWCVRGLIAGHYDIRAAWNEPAGTGMVRRIKTFAGCYFTKGENKGPDIEEDAAHNFTRVTWTNLNARKEGTGYVFKFDWGTKKLTITATTAGKAPAVAVIDPPDDFDRLEDLLPEP